MKLQTFICILLCGVPILEAGEFFHANGTDYYLSYPMRMNWFQALRFCNYYGLHLISIHSFEEEQIILSVIKQFKSKYNISTGEHIHVYTSGTDLGHLTNEYFWTTTGHPFVYKNWIPGFPTLNRPPPDLAHDCVILNDQHSLKWHNLNCSNTYYCMCQNRITIPEVNRSIDPSHCQLN